MSRASRGNGFVISDWRSCPAALSQVLPCAECLISARPCPKADRRKGPVPKSNLITFRLAPPRRMLRPIRGVPSLPHADPIASWIAAPRPTIAFPLGERTKGPGFAAPGRAATRCPFAEAPSLWGDLCGRGCLSSAAPSWHSRGGNDCPPPLPQEAPTNSEAKPRKKTGSSALLVELGGHGGSRSPQESTPCGRNCAPPRSYHVASWWTRC